MTSQIIESLRDAFGFLKGAGFVECQAEYAPESFGNAYLEFKSANLLISAVRDRSQFRVEFASLQDQETWFDLDLVLRILDADDASRRAANPNANLEELAAVLQRWLAPIEGLFEGDYATLKKRLFDVADLRFRESFGAYQI